MITFTYRDRDDQPGELTAPAFAVDAVRNLYALDEEGDRRFIGQFEDERLNVAGEEWTHICFFGEIEVRVGMRRRQPVGNGLSVGCVQDSLKLYDRGTAGTALGLYLPETKSWYDGVAPSSDATCSHEVLICQPFLRQPLPARTRLSALAA